MMEIDGFTAPRFALVREPFLKNFIERGDTGAAFAVMIDGEIVVDLWGGTKNRNNDKAWNADTLVNLFSVSKGVISACILRLLQENRIDLEKPVCHYWPAFSGLGKDAVLVKHILHHLSGLTAFKLPIPAADLYQFKKMLQHCEMAELWHPPGQTLAYTPFTFGWLVGGLIYSVTGKTPGVYFRETFAEPYRFDLHFGVPESEIDRIADLLPIDTAQLSEQEAVTEPESILQRNIQNDPNGIAASAFMNPDNLLVKTNSLAWRQSEIPAANAHGSATALATFYGLMVGPSDKDNSPIVTTEILAELSRPQVAEKDLTTGIPLAFSHGFMLSLISKTLAQPLQGCFGHPGAGGSLGFADPRKRLGFGYVTRNIGGHGVLIDPRAAALIAAVYAAV